MVKKKLLSELKEKLMKCIKSRTICQFFDKETKFKLYKNLFESNSNPNLCYEDYDKEFKEVALKKFMVKVTVKNVEVN